MTRKIKLGHLLICRMLDIEFHLVRELEVPQCAVGHLLEDFPAFLSPHDYMISRKLLAMQHLEGLQPPDRSSTPGAWCSCSHRLRWPMFCSFGKCFVATFPSCFWGAEGSRHSIFFRALLGQGCFRSPGTSSLSFTPLNGSHPAVLQFQHLVFHFCEA